MAGSKLSVGNVEILVLQDNETTFPLSMVFPNVSPEAFSGNESLRIHFDCFLIRSEGRTILVDTGLGSNATNPGSVAAFGGGVDGKLMAELQANGIAPDDIDTVFFTHLHPDHVGWNLTKDGSGTVATFPKAKYLAHRADWDTFRKPEVQEAFPAPFWEETLGPLEALGVVEALDGEQALTSEITAICTPGHTPGSMSLAVVSGGQRALILGDVFHGPAQVTETEWVFSFDMDPDLAIQTRQQLIERAETENAIVGICHHSGFGRIVRSEGRRYWQGL